MVTRTELILRREEMELTLDRTLEMFLATKQTEGRTPKTISWYQDMITRFIEYLQDGTPTTLAHFSLDNARSFVASLQNQETRYADHPFREEVDGGLAPSTIHGYVRALKAFASWLHEEEFTEANRLHRLKRPKLPEPVIEILSDEEILRLLASIKPRSVLGSRQYLLVAMLLDTGMRASELCHISLDDISLDDCYIKLKGKGRKERIVPFSPTTKKHLIRYLATWRSETNDRQLFVSSTGRPMVYDRLAHTIKRLGVNAGIPRLHAHLLRHTFAVKYLVNGGDVMSLRRILGHTTLDVTKTYMHLAESHIQVLHHRYSPLERVLAKGR